jgi:hypothetical protein
LSRPIVATYPRGLVAVAAIYGLGPVSHKPAGVSPGVGCRPALPLDWRRYEKFLGPLVDGLGDLDG